MLELKENKPFIKRGYNSNVNGVFQFNENSHFIVEMDAVQTDFTDPSSKECWFLLDSQ